MANPVFNQTWIEFVSGKKVQNLMRTTISKLQLSARAYQRILKLARAIAIQLLHLAELLQYRPKIMMG